MSKRFIIAGLAIPGWLIIATIAAASAGATAATVIAGQLTGEMPVTVGQALVLDAKAQSACIALESATCDRYTTSCSPDGTRFQAAVETFPGEFYDLKLGLVNRSSQQVYGLLTINNPPGFTVSVGESFDMVNEVTQLTNNTWKFRVLAGAAGDRDSDGTIDDYLKIRVALSPEIQPGFYSLAGKIAQLAY